MISVIRASLSDYSRSFLLGAIDKFCPNFNGDLTDEVKAWMSNHKPLFCAGFASILKNNNKKVWQWTGYPHYTPVLAEEKINSDRSYCYHTSL